MEAKDIFEIPMLNPLHVEAIVRAAESALDIRRRYQFFVWSQGNLQVLLPHQLAVCGGYQRNARELVFDVFNSVSLPEELLRALTQAHGPLMLQLQNRWLAARSKPLSIAVAALDGAALAPHRQALASAGFTHLLAHGLSRPQRPSEIESFFVFAQLSSEVTQQQCHHLELLLPHIHATWQRVQALEREIKPGAETAAAAPRDAHACGITARERQILSWLREGKSNQEIGEVLSISALTVKNHVQKILRKLNAANRAQAVARAMSLNLLDDMAPDAGPAS